MTHCPLCGDRAVGKVGADQYFCWDCCVEFMLRGQNLTIYNVGLDGSLTVYGAPGQDAVNLQMQEG
jgi:hypothetical protein